MQDVAKDPVVFAEGVHRHVRDGVEVTLVVPQDVHLSQIAVPLAKLAEAAELKGGGDVDAA